MSKHSSKNKEDKKTREEYEQLGRMLVTIYETGYITDKKLYKMSFLKGIVTGLGATIGATIVLSLVVWILSSLPVIDNLTEGIQNSIEQNREP